MTEEYFAYVSIMTEEQLESLMQYVRAVAAREAVIAAAGHAEGGYELAERSCEDNMRRLFLGDEKLVQD
jgi:hypothetical protein